MSENSKPVGAPVLPVIRGLSPTSVDKRKRTSSIDTGTNWEKAPGRQLQRSNSFFLQSRLARPLPTNRGVTIGKKSSEPNTFKMPPRATKTAWQAVTKPTPPPVQSIPPPPPPPIPQSKPTTHCPPSLSKYPPIPVRSDLGEEPPLPPSPPPEEITEPENPLPLKLEPHVFTMEVKSTIKNENFNTPSPTQLELLAKGSELYQLTKKGKLQKIWLEMSSPGCFTLRESEKGKIKDNIQFKDIISIQKGHHTPNLVNYKETVGSDLLCFSIYSRDIIDLVAENEDLCDAWYDSITVMLQMFKQLQ